MKKVININFQGRVIPIEETAFDLLKQYTDSLRTYFANEDGRDEIINDIESRIAELFEERLKAGSTCMTDDDVNSIIANMGRPQDFADADSTGDYAERTSASASAAYAQAPSTGSKRLYRDENHKILGGVCSGIAAYFNIEPIIVRLVFIFSGIGFVAYLLLWAFVPASDKVFNGVKKRLYRNPDEKVLGGVCSGIAAYFDINVWIPRAIFLLPFISFIFRWGHFGPFSFPHFLSFSFSPGTFLVYVILWMVLPEANTTAQKLEMKGEKIDLNTIKNSVMEEMKGVKERVTKAGSEAATAVSGASSTMARDMGGAARRTGRSLGDIIVAIAKMFGYFVVGCVAFALVVSLFGLAIVALGLFPLKNYVINDGWQNFFAWGSLLFFIGVPVVGVITWIIRRLAKIKTKNYLIRYTFLALWLLGIFCFISLLFSVFGNFKSTNTPVEEMVTLSNPAVGKLIVLPTASTKYFGEHGWLRMEPFENTDEDTAFVNGVRLRIVKSVNDSFKVTYVKFANGNSRRYADTTAARISFTAQQLDSILYVDRGIAISSMDKFRNQHVVLTIAVPVGKMINIGKKLNTGFYEHFNGPWNNGDWDHSWENEEVTGWENHYGQDLIMKADGLYTLDGKPATEGDHDYHRGRRVHITPGKIEVTDDGEGDDEDNTKVIIDGRDSTTRENLKRSEKSLERMNDSLEKMKEKINKHLEKLDEGSNPTEALHGKEYAFMLDI